LKEIASAVGTLIDIDGPTRNRTFGHYAWILVDIDLSKRAYDEILVEREGFAFKVEMQYERRPLFCHHCYSIGHNVSSCRWLHPQPPNAKDGYILLYARLTLTLEFEDCSLSLGSLLFSCLFSQKLNCTY